MDTRYESFLFEPNRQEEILCNDGSSFAQPTFFDAEVHLKRFSSLRYGSKVRVYPQGYEEDEVERAEKENFHLSDWSLIALSIDNEMKPVRGLLIHSSRHNEGFVFDFKKEIVITLFFRGFAVREYFGDRVQQENEFLESIGLKEVAASAPQSFYALPFDDEEEDEDIEEGAFDISRPLFLPNVKRKIVNFGGSYHVEEEEEEDENEEDLNINVDRPAFAPNSKRKIPNLNAPPNRPKKKIKPVKPSRVEAVPEEEPPYVAPSKPAFQAVSKNKVPNLNDKPDRPKRAKPAPQPTEEPSTPINVPRPAFAPTKKHEIQNLDGHLIHNVDAGEELKVSVRTPRQHMETAPEITNEWSVVANYKLRPDVYKQERAILNIGSRPEDRALCEQFAERLNALTTVKIWSRCVFVKEKLSADDPRLALANPFVMKDWDLLAMTLDVEDKPVAALLANKKETNLCFLLSFRHREPRLVLVSLEGIAVNDPALPFYSYSALWKEALS